MGDANSPETLVYTYENIPRHTSQKTVIWNVGQPTHFYNHCPRHILILSSIFRLLFPRAWYAVSCPAFTRNTKSSQWLDSCHNRTAINLVNENCLFSLPLHFNSNEVGSNRCQEIHATDSPRLVITVSQILWSAHLAGHTEIFEAQKIHKILFTSQYFNFNFNRNFHFNLKLRQAVQWTV
jgi:hypothetical protein